MAVVWIFRLGVMVAPVVARYCASTGCDAQQASNTIARFWDRISSPDEDTAALSSDMTTDLALEGGAIAVTDFPEPFELRKLMWRLSRAPGGVTEDQDVCTFHFIKATGGVAGSWVDGTDLPAVETALGTYFNSLKVFYPSFMHSDQYRWYKDGPAFYTLSPDKPQYVPIGDNPAIRVTEVDVAGSSTSDIVFSPQTAVSITEKTSSRKHWGRWYLPAPIYTVGTNVGRLASTYVDNFAAYAVTFYNSCRAAGVVPVVFSIQKPDRPKASGGTLPAVPAVAYEVGSIQVDDLLDVIRRRRYDSPTYRKVTALT